MPSRIVYWTTNAYDAIDTFRSSYRLPFSSRKLHEGLQQQTASIALKWVAVLSAHYTPLGCVNYQRFKLSVFPLLFLAISLVLGGIFFEFLRKGNFGSLFAQSKRNADLKVAAFRHSVCARLSNDCKARKCLAIIAGKSNERSGRIFFGNYEISMSCHFYTPPSNPRLTGAATSGTHSSSDLIVIRGFELAGKLAI